MKDKVLHCIKVSIMTVVMTLVVYAVVLLETLFVIFEAPISIIILTIAGCLIIWIYIFAVLYGLLFE